MKQQNRVPYESHRNNCTEQYSPLEFEEDNPISTKIKKKHKKKKKNRENGEENIDKKFTYLTVTDKIAQARHELRCKTMRKQADVSLTAEK